jgi:hypothetical protein
MEVAKLGWTLIVRITVEDEKNCNLSTGIDCIKKLEITVMVSIL